MDLKFRNSELDELELRLQSEPDLIQARDPITGYTALHFAAATGHTPLVRKLLTLNADPFAEDAHGLWPIDIANSVGPDDLIAVLERRMFVADAENALNDDDRTFSNDTLHASTRRHHLPKP